MMWWNLDPLASMPTSWMPFIAVISVWSLIWKGFGLWKAGRNNQLWWFIAMLVLNTAGVLPIVYLLFFQKNRSVFVLPKAGPVLKKGEIKKKKR